MSVNISGGYDWQKLTLRNSSIKVRGNTLGFSGVVDWSGKRPKINASFESNSINLADVFPALYDNKWVRPDRELNVFKDIPLFGDIWVNYDVNLHIMLDNFIVYRNFTF